MTNDGSHLPADSFAGQLTSKRWPLIAGLACGALLVVGVIVVVLAVVLGDRGDGVPTAADRKALADEICPRVEANHFYRITKDGKTSYLLGTRHAGVSLAKFPPAVAQAFDAARVVALESTFERGDALVEARSVEAQLGPELWAKYEALVGDAIAQRVNHRSARAATAALVLLYEDASQSLDVELAARARTARKQLVGLDDEEHAAPEPTADLGEVYLGVATLQTALRQIHRRTLLRSMTVTTLRRFCRGPSSPAGGGGDFEGVTNQRTRRWVAKVLPLLAEGNAFIAVGVMHVDMGTLGLGELLEQEGYKVEPWP